MLGSSVDASERLWKRFGEMFGDRFFTQYGAKPNDSWREAVKELRGDQVREALTKIRNGGSAYPPSLPEFMGLAKNVAPPRSDADLRPAVDIFAAYGNRALYSWLWTKDHAPSRASLAKILAEKERICDAYRSICTEEPEASLELRDKLFDAWDRVYEIMPTNELEMAVEKFQRVGHL